MAMTNREFYTTIINANISDEITAFAQSAIEKLDKRNSSRKPTAKQTENEGYKATILNDIEPNVTYTAAQVGEMLGISTNKASALLRQLTEDRVLVASEVKIKGKGKVKGYTYNPAEGAESAEPDEDAED